MQLSDEGTRLTIDGIAAIDNWVDQTAVVVSSQPIMLTAGLHEISLEYYEKSGSAQVELRWACATCTPSLAEEVIPSSALRPGWLNQTSVVSPTGRVSFSHVAGAESDLVDYELVKLSDGTNVVTSYSYDSAGRVTQKVMPKGNAGRTIDSAGNLQGSPNLTYATDWTYYGLADTATSPAACGGGTAVGQAGLPKSVTPHGVATTTTVYDAAGHAIAETNGAGTTCSTYDGEGRLTSEKAPGDVQATTYTYDPAGGRRSAEDASGTVTTEYDEAGRVKRGVDSFGAEATFGYDEEGNLGSRTAAAGALSTNPNYTTVYSYDDAGQLTSLTDPAARVYTFTYDRQGNLRTVQYPNGTFAWHDYNVAGWLTAVYNRHGTLPTPLPGSVPTDSQASPLSDYGYAHDIEGRKTEDTRTGGVLTTETSAYTYDSLGRLDTVVLPDGTLRRYRFDLDSNRTEVEETPPGGSAQTVATYTYDAAQTPGEDQLTSVTENGQTKTFAYTADGQVSVKGEDTIGWDGWGRMSGGTFSGTPIAYGFDPLSFRRSRSEGGQVTRYLLGGIFETTETGTITLSDVDGVAGDVARYAGAPDTSSGIKFIYYSARGDVAAEATETGTRTDAFTYDPFGSLRSGAMPASGTSEGYTGRWDKKVDRASGLIEMGSRTYDPTIGRFLSIDPIPGAAWNAYDYALQDPINVYDLDGRKPIHGAPTGGAAFNGIISKLKLKPYRPRSRSFKKHPNFDTWAFASYTRVRRVFFGLARAHRSPVTSVRRLDGTTVVTLKNGGKMVLRRSTTGTKPWTISFGDLARAGMSVGSSKIKFQRGPAP